MILAKVSKLHCYPKNGDLQNSLRVCNFRTKAKQTGKNITRTNIVFFGQKLHYTAKAKGQSKVKANVQWQNFEFE